MSETKSATLSGVPETYLAPLYWGAMESLRPDAMIKDEKAEALVARTAGDLSPPANCARIWDASKLRL
jgi:O-methyltransferase involved in polyketide biosynthesis